MTARFEIQPPIHLTAILAAGSTIGFTMGSDALVGSLLRTPAASKPGGNLIEIGTGTGLSAAWLLDGMDENARLTSVDQDAQAQQVAPTHLGGDSRVDALLEKLAARTDLTRSCLHWSSGLLIGAKSVEA